MSTGFARRFISLIDQFAQGNKKQFAELTGKSPSHVYRICRGTSRPSMAYLEHLYSLFSLDLNWLLTGEKPIEQDSFSSTQDLLLVPKLDVEVSAGFGSEVGYEEIDEQFALNKRWLSSQLSVHSDQLAFVSVRGDSMLPTLYHGDMVLMDLSQKQPSGEGIFVLQTQDGLMAKRLQQKSDHVAIIQIIPVGASMKKMPSTITSLEKLFGVDAAFNDWFTDQHRPRQLAPTYAFLYVTRTCPLPK